MVTQITINKASPPLVPNTFASQPSFTQKILNFQINLAQNSANAQPTSFASAQGIGTPGSFNISGVRSQVRIRNATAPAGSYADVSIWGLDQGLMNELASLGVLYDSVSKNQILISAGASSDDDASAFNANETPLQGFPVIFGGTIWFAYGDYSRMPDVPFRITAQLGLFNAVQSVTPGSWNGATSIVSVMQSFANQLGVPLENNGVSGSITNPYFPGTILQQLYAAAEHANITAMLVDGGTKLAIWPIPGSRTSQTNIPLISPDTGMIGYPSFANNGWLAVKMLYNPDVIFGGNIQVESSIPQANKTWTVQQLDLALDSLMPDGEWMGTALCQPKGTNPGVAPSVS
jgi:baseplate hub protein gp41